MIKPMQRLRGLPGEAVCAHSWIMLPIYLPRASKIPDRDAPDDPTAAQASVQLALELAKDLNDYATQVLYYKLFALFRRDPGTLLPELSQLQKTVQGDGNDYQDGFNPDVTHCKSLNLAGGNVYWVTELSPPAHLSRHLSTQLGRHAPTT